MADRFKSPTTRFDKSIIMKVSQKSLSDRRLGNPSFRMRIVSSIPAYRSWSATRSATKIEGFNSRLGLICAQKKVSEPRRVNGMPSCTLTQRI